MLPPLSARTGLLCCAVVFCFLPILKGQILTSQSGEYHVGGAISGDQLFPCVSINSADGYVAWEDNRVDANNGHGIAALRLDASFAAKGSIFRVNQQAAGDQGKPQVLLLNNGNALFVWESRQGARSGVFARVVDVNGNFVTGDVLVNRPSSTELLKQSTNWFGFYRNRWKQRRFKFRDRIENIREQVGSVAAGALPQLRWTGSKYSTNDLLRPLRYAGDWMQDVFCQRLDSAGRKVGSEMLVNQSVDFNQRSPGLAVLPNGNFVVVWISESPRSGNWRDNFRVSVMGRICNGQGEPVGDEFAVAAGDDLVHANPVVGALAGGGFTVLWSQQEAMDSRHWDVYGRAFGADATPAGPAFRVNAYTTGDQFGPKVAGIGDQQLVVWTSVGQDGSREGVYGRLLAAGVLAGEEFRLNTTTVSRQIHPTVAADGRNRWVSVWASYVGETGFDLFGQSFSIGGGQSALLKP